MRLNPLHIFFIFCFIFFASANTGYSQTLLYDIYKGDDRIGEIVVEKVIQGSKVHYEANSEASFRLIFMNDLTTNTAADFINNELSYSMSKITLNDKTREHTITKKEGHFYNYYKHKEENYKKKESPFRISTVTLYYSEPAGVKQVFSENYQQLCDLKVIGTNAYELTLPGGKINQYFYKNGRLVEIKVFRTFVDLSFKLKEQS
jgi:hypothetical protein